MTPLQDILEAKKKAESVDFGEYKIDYAHANYHSDKRKGHVHGWSASGYVGAFTTHATAIKAGATVTRIRNIWFDWR